jgi:hypothetical protein
MGTAAITSAKKERAGLLASHLLDRSALTSLPDDSLVIVNVLSERLHKLQQLQFLALDSYDISFETQPAILVRCSACWAVRVASFLSVSICDRYKWMSAMPQTGEHSIKSVWW